MTTRDDPVRETGTLYAFGPFLLLASQRTLLHNGQDVRIGSRAFDILTVLVEHAGQVVSKEHLLARAWPDTVVDEGGLRVHVAALRKALGETRSGPRYISNVPTRGYCFVGHVTRTSGGRAQASRRPEPAAAPLPSLLTRLVGREEAIATLIRAIPQRRFVTLVGTGGLGKTTAAVAAAAELEAAYADGVHFVDLASIADPALLAGTVAAALGVAAGTAAEVLDWLAARSALLVLDNCEHVIEAAAAFAEAAAARGGGSHLLATSREPLRARGEWVIRLPALAAPPADAPTTYAQALAYPAFELFVERAAASAEGVTFTDADVLPIAMLCLKLDGIPLAIELVASQIGFYGLSGLTAMLDGRLALTALGQRTAMARHQTLRGTLDWSFGLLSPLEQRIVCRLSVFRERFSLQAALLAAGERAAEASHVLVSLVSKSLLVADPGDDGVSYRLLETTRGYVQEKLAATEDAAHVYRRHAGYCVGLAQSAAIELEEGQAQRWRERNFRKIDDVRAALTWTLRDRGDVELGATLAANSAALFFGLWMTQEYMQWLERAIEALPATALESKLEMQLCLEFGHSCIALRGGSPEGLVALLRGAAIARQTQTLSSELSALRAECGGRLLHGDYRGAHATALQFAELARSSRDARAALTAHRMTSISLHGLGEHGAAFEELRDALPPVGLYLRQVHGNISQPDHRTAALTHLARIHWVSGRADSARLAARDALDSAHAVGHGFSLTYTLTFAACPVALWSGELDAAERHIEDLAAHTDAHMPGFWQSWPRIYRQALERLRRVGHAPMQGPPLAGLHAGQLDMLASFDPSLVGEEAVARAAAGLNPWCAPEVIRARGLHAQLDGDTHAAAGLLRQALDLARQQGAHAWALRSAISLLRLEETAQARAALSCAVEKVQAGGISSDLREARHLLASSAAAAAPAPA